MRRCSGTLYDALQVARDATPNDIKKAYHKMALQLHPDKTGGTTTEEFKKIQEANAILSDADLRKKYDTFGREGMQQLTSLGVPAELLNGLVLRLLMIFTSVLSILLLIWTSLVVVRIDEHRTWSWAAIWTPVWVLCLSVVVLGVALIVQALIQKSLEFFLMGILLLFGVICNATAVAAFDGRLTYAHASVPFFIAFVIEFIHAVTSLQFERFKAFHDMFPSEASEGMEGPCHHLYIRSCLWEAWRKVTTLLFLVLVYLRATSADYADLDFFRIFAPLLARCVIATLHGCYLTWCLAAEESFVKRVVMMLSTASGATPVLYTLCMIARKANAEFNGSSEYNPSAGVCAIFIFITLALGAIGGCIAMCCVQVPSPEEAYHAEGESPAASTTEEEPRYQTV